MDLSSLGKAIEALENSLRVARETSETLSEEALDTIRAGVIQHFEVAYEQCWKFTQRWLRINASPEEADFPRTRKELFRMAARQGLILDPLVWFEYGNARNLSSQTYDEDQAVIVFEAAVRFLPDARKLLDELRSRND